jgi:hypothetical protein
MQNSILSNTYKNIITGLCILLIASGLNAQKTDYQSIFGTDWEKAVRLLEENDHWIRPALDKYKITYSEAVAVIFPELVRYSALRDRMETGVLKALYVNLGHEYANFSVGLFQVKPSFAEMIREDAQKVIGNRAREIFGRREPAKDEKKFRASIVSELEEPQKEFNYIIAFYLICRKRFSDMPESDTLRIKFLASAYNTGYRKSVEEINMMADKKFYNIKLFSKEKYSYSDVSLFWYYKYNNRDNRRGTE